jgi:hypothetical protein
MLTYLKKNGQSEIKVTQFKVKVAVIDLLAYYRAQQMEMSEQIMAKVKINDPILSKMPNKFNWPKN